MKKEDERRRAERFGQDKRGNLITGSKAPKTKPSKKPSKDKKPERTYPKKAWELWLEKNFIFSGKIDPKTGKKKKIKFKEQYDLDDFETEKEHET